MIQLDQNQQKAVYSRSNKILVVACAGSGKTRVLTERIRHLIVDENVDPSSIVAITLTNQAADEIVSRLLDVEGINNVFIGTIHSFAYSILRNLGYNFKILSDELDYELHMELIEKYCEHITKEDYEKYRTKLLGYKLGLIDESELTRSLSRESLSELVIIESGTPTEDYPETIKTICDARNIIRFDDLLRLVVKSGYYLKVGHLLIDEFQDIGSLEYDFIRKFDVDNIFMVGDDWQSIYSFRGSNVEIFRSLYNDDTYEKYILDNNYRSSKNIVELSNKIIDWSDDKIDKPVNPINTSDGNIANIRDKSLRELLGTIRSSDDYRSWFILARSNKDVVYLSTVLQREGIPYSIFRRDGMTGNDIKVLMYNDTVKLMTIHASKGLESDNVILYGNYGTPVLDYCKNLKDEEIRVFYVGVTRARKNLVIVTKNSWGNKVSSVNASKIRHPEPVLRINSATPVNKLNFNKAKKSLSTYLDNKVGIHAMECTDDDDIPDENGNYLMPDLGRDNPFNG